MARVKPKAPEGFYSKLTLLGQRWQVVYHNQKTEDLGSSDGAQRTIEINLAQCHGSMVDTLYHEIMHAYFRMLPGLSDAPTLPEEGEYAEECLVVACTTAALDLAANNGWVMSLVMGK